MGLQSRILAFFLALLLIVLVVTLATVSRATYRHTLARAQDELAYARRIFLDKLEARQSSLRESASTIAKDDALRQTIFVAGDDRGSLRLALDNHRRRTNAEVAFLVGLDGTELADTARAEREGHPFPFRELLDPNRPAGAVEARVLDGVAYQVVAVPYYVPVSAPQPSFWLVLARALDDALARELHELAGVEVAILAREPGAPPRVMASSLGAEGRAGIGGMSLPPAQRVVVRELGGNDYLAALATLPSGDSPALEGLLLRSTSQALLDYHELSGRFLLVAGGAALLALLGAVVVTRGVTRPLRTLERAAARIGAGDYATEMPRSGGEVGRLAAEFAAMQRAMREREAAIQHLAYHDDLTGLPNRNRFRDELARRIESSAREHVRCAIAIADLDRFKEINDTLGHHVGDRLLLEVADRLRGIATRRDWQIARLGGDEYAVLLGTSGVAEARESVEALRAALVGPVELDDLRVDLEASVGVALFPDHGGDPATLLRHAEVAMYVAKQQRIGATFYDPELDRHSVERLSLVGDLRAAIAGDGLELVFQPKLDLRTGRVEEAEALVRWRHERRGPISPAVFIPVAEQTGLIRDLTSWVLRQALAQLAAWRRAGRPLRLAVNLSALDLHDLGLAARLRELLAQYEVAAEDLVLEITESSVMAEPETARRLLDEVTAMGIAVSVDDFGTGYSSLAQLQRLPVRELKVDRSFITEIERSADLHQIVRTIVELGHNLGLRVVGEGVESGGALGVLKEMGCDVAQGYFLSPPLGAADLASWLERRRTGVGGRA